MEANPIEYDRRGNGFEMRPWACPTCGPGPVRVLGVRGGSQQRSHEGVETNIVRCRSCGLLFPQPFPVPLDPQRLYGDPAEYFASHALDEKIPAYRSLAREVRGRMEDGLGRLLDVGAGRGDFLHAAALEGFEATVGLELSRAMVDFAEERFGIHLRTESVESLARRQPSAFDAVVLNAVLEHVYDPLGFMRAVERLARPGAVLYIDIPREPHLLSVVGNLWNRARGRRAVFNLQPTWTPFHVYGFNPRALRILLERTGFRIEEIAVHARPEVSPGPGVRGRLAASVATQVNRVANRIGYASNMYVWARKVA